MFIKDILGKSKNNLDHEIKKHTKLALLAAAIPNREYLDISLLSAYADGTVTLEIPTRKDLESVMKEFPPVDLVLVQNGSASIMPLMKMTKTERANYLDKIAPVYFQLQQWVPNKLHQDFIWYCQKGDLLVKVIARVKDDPAHYEAAHSYGGRHGNRISSYGWRTQSLPGTLGVTYSNSHAPQTPNIVLSYWEKECTLEDIFDML